jgi:type IV pilus assembly protein PilB
MIIDDDKIKGFIADAGLVSKGDLDSALEESKASGKQFCDLLISKGLITENDMKRMQAYLLGIPFASLVGEKIDFEVLSIIPEPIARSHNIISYKKDDVSLEVAMLDTDDLSAIDFITRKTGLKILPRLTSPDSIKNALVQYQRNLKAEFGDIIKKETGEIKTLTSDPDASADDLKKMAEDVPVVRIVDTLLKHAIIQKASDIHIEPTEQDVVVRYRIDGMLHDAMTLPKTTGVSITARLKVLSNLKLDEKRLPQDGRFKIELDSEKVSFRVSVLPVFYGEKTVMRILREGGGHNTLESLGFHGDGLEKLHDATRQSTGMILTTGPTGSGKTTTLYTLMEILNQPDVNISTIEDPIEYQMPRINQSQVKPEIGFTFASGIRSLVRQDPDIIMVGEIRDNETASLAVNASLTGHLVLSTLHTNSAAGCIPRLLDMKIESFLLVSTLYVVIGQRLVRRLGPKREKYTLTKAGIAELAKIVDIDRVMKVLKDEKVVDEKATWETIPFYKPKVGKDEEGYEGRIGIHEVLKMTETLKEMIIKGQTADEIQRQAMKEGMMTMLEDGVYKAVRGYTTIEEILRVVNH